MKKNITLRGKKIEYTIKKSARAKRVRLSINCDAQMVVTVPRLVSSWTVERFIRQKAEWIIRNIEKIKHHSVFLNQGQQMNYQECKDKARKFIEQRIKQCNQAYNLEYNKICIKNHKRIWGSCSSKKNLNFNYRLIFLPSGLADYIIIHELCHLQEMNHSSRFWQLVAKMVPDYKQQVRELKRIRF